MKNTEMNHFPIKVKTVEPTPLTPVPWHQRRVAIALRRIVWLIGVVPVFLISSTIAIFGLTISLTWMVISWLTGSNEPNGYLCIWMLDVADWIEKSWRLLKE